MPDLGNSGDVQLIHMSVDLGVWHSDEALSVKEALKFYLKLCRQEAIVNEQHPGMAAFYSELCERYPEIDTLSEDQVDHCPWSCAHQRSDLSVIICMNYGDELEKAAQYVIDLAAKYSLVCFDPQGPNLYAPPNLQPKKSRFRFW